MAKIYDLSVSLRPDHLENSELALNRVSHQEAARIFARRHRVKVSDLPHAAFFRVNGSSCAVTWGRTSTRPTTSIRLPKAVQQNI